MLDLKSALFFDTKRFSCDSFQSRFVSLVQWLGVPLVVILYRYFTLNLCCSLRGTGYTGPSVVPGEPIAFFISWLCCLFIKIFPMNVHNYTVSLRTSLNTCNVNPLTPNDPYNGRTAPLTSKRCILYIYSTNIGTEYFKHGIYSPFFFSLFKMQFISLF